MSRVARVVVPKFPHHVTQRGNRQAKVFETAGDAKTYLRYLREHSQKRGLSVWAYCLMSNHVHLIAVPDREESLSDGFRDVHTLYAMYFNTRTEQMGHLWQGRFYSCTLDDTHLWAAVRYVELNPVRAGIVARAEDYPWSSAVAHCGLRRDPLLAPGLPLVDIVSDWRTWLSDEIETDEALQAAIRKRTATGRPCGSDEFVGRIETATGRSLRPKRRGPQGGTEYRKG